MATGIMKLNVFLGGIIIGTFAIVRVQADTCGENTKCHSNGCDQPVTDVVCETTDNSPLWDDFDQLLDHYRAKSDLTDDEDGHLCGKMHVTGDSCREITESRGTAGVELCQDASAVLKDDCIPTRCLANYMESFVKKCGKGKGKNRRIGGYVRISDTMNIRNYHT